MSAASEATSAVAASPRALARSDVAAAGGEMAARLRDTDWSQTPLGPMEQWPDALRVAVGICLNSRFPMFVWWGPELINIYNDAYAPMLGKRHPEAFGRPARWAWDDIWDAVGPQAEAVFRGQATWNERVPLLMERYGYAEETWFTWSYSPIPDGLGGVGGLFCAVTEETQRILAERERDRLAEQSRAILESITDAFFALDRDFRFTYVNAQAERVLGRNPGDLLGKVIWDEYAGLYGSPFERDYRRASTERIAGSVTAYYPDHERWYEVHTYPAPDGGVSVYFRDATERVRAEAERAALTERLERQTRLFDAALSSITDYFFVFDPQGRFVYANAPLLALWGRTAQQAIGHTMRDLDYPPQVEAQVLRNLRRVLATRAPVGDETPYANESGASGYFEYLLAPVLAPDGTVELIAGTARDITARKEMAAERERLLAALEHERSRLAQVIERAPAFICTFRGPDHVYELANERYHEIVGQRPIIGRTIRDALPELEGQGFFELLDNVYRTGETFVGNEVPVRLHRPEADVPDLFYLNFIYQALREADGTISGIFVHGVDVTEMVRAREAISASERRFRELADAMPQIVWTARPDGLLDYYNQRWYAYTGLPPEQTGADWELVVHPDDVARVHPIWGESVRSGQPYEVEFRLRRAADGMYRWFLARALPVRDEQGRVVRWFGTATDIHDSKLAEEAVRLGRERMELVVRGASVGVWYCPLPFDRLIWDETVKAHFHLPPNADVTIEMFYDRLHPDDRERTRQTIEASIARREPYDVEYRTVSPDGTDLKWIRATGRGFYDESGRPVRFDGITIDVTAAKEAAAERERLLASERAARGEAERAGRMKDEFLATLSHELRTPLNAILGWAQILAAGVRDEADLAEGLQTIERNARSQVAIIEDLLDMSRILSGKLRLDVQQVELASVVQAAVETVRPAANARGIRLHVVLDSLAGPVSGDPNRLQQVFWNLLSNAVKFTPRDGRVQVVLERVRSHVEVSVIDSGEGIAPEFLPHVFDRFRQADASSTRRHGGLGLGLAIVRNLVELHGGTVRVKSPGKGQGSTFVVALPLVALHPEALPETERHSAPAGAGPRFEDACARIAGVKVLVVDDEPDARTLVRRLLEDCDATVATAGSAAEAIEQLQAARPDVLVSDIGMPGEDGYSLIQRIRALAPDRGGAVPALALTAYARAEDRRRAILAGFQMHIAKPVEPAELIAIIASLSGRVGKPK